MTRTLAKPRRPAARPARSVACDVLLVIAHPDDEVFASGTLCLLGEAGSEVALVHVTDGEGGGPEPQSPAARRALATARRRELERSAEVLGVRRLHALHQPDVADPLAQPGGWDEARVVRDLSALLVLLRPRLILTHGPQGGYGHPAHRLTFHCVTAAAEAADYRGAIYSFCAEAPKAFFSWHFDQRADLLVDVRGFAARRAASLACHASQQDYFLQPFQPRTLRKRLSALFGYAFRFTAAGRKRIPIATPETFVTRFPTEGLARQRAADDGHDLLGTLLAHDHRIQPRR